MPAATRVALSPKKPAVPSRSRGESDAELKNRPWFAGDEFSAADIQMSFPLEAAAARAGLDARYPKLTDWLQRIHARSAYQRALERGGPYKILD